MSTSIKTCLYQDQLDSLLVLAAIMPQKKLSVIRSLINYLQPDTLKSTATREQIWQDTGIPLRTLYRYIQEFVQIGLLQKWRGPFEKKQCYYKLNLPVAPSVLEFYAQPSVAAAKSSKQVSQSFIETGEIEANMDPAGFHEHAQTDTSFDSPCNPADSSDELENPEGNEFRTIQLDALISAALDKLEKNHWRNETAQFLTALGFLEPQLASDEKLVIDREGLLKFLLEQNANSPERFCELLNEFIGSAQREMPPSIDIPMHESIELCLYYEFDLRMHPFGEDWLWKMVQNRDEYDCLLPEPGIRRSLLKFMQENGLKTLKEVAALAAEKHNEKIKQMKAPTYLPYDSSFAEMRPGEWSCKALMDQFVDDDPSWQAEISITEETADLLKHCNAKVDREYPYRANPLFKSSQRQAIAKALFIIGSQHPLLIGYQPEKGDVFESRDHPCC